MEFKNSEMKLYMQLCVANNVSRTEAHSDPKGLTMNGNELGLKL